MNLRHGFFSSDLYPQKGQEHGDEKDQISIIFTVFHSLPLKASTDLETGLCMI